MTEGPTPGGERTRLAEILPLDTPFMIQMFPAYACNFRCGYCIFALERKERGFISDVPMMEWDLYTKCIDDMRAFPRKLKMLRFAAIGEPLLHPRIADMVAYARDADIAASIDIVTNGSLLTPALSDSLIAAGLGRLRVSLEGLSAEEYQANARAAIDYEAFVGNLRYFYEHSGDTTVYIKIIDYMVQSDDRKKLFYDTFVPIAHAVNIEHLTPTVEEIDYDELTGGMEISTSKGGRELLDTSVCPQPFYLMQINPDGKIVPCCSMKYPALLGDANTESVTALWSGKLYNAFRLKMLSGKENAGTVCKRCSLYRYDLYEEDLLDAAAERLKEAYGGNT